MGGKREEKWDAHHEDDLLRGKGIMELVTRLLAITARAQKEKETGSSKVDTDGVGLESPNHPVLTLTGGLQKPEEHQQVQHTMQPKLEVKAKAEVKASYGTDIDNVKDINPASGVAIRTDTDKTAAESPITKSNEAGQPSRTPDSRLKHGRLITHPDARQE